MNTWDWNYVWEILPALLVGLGRTVLATVLGTVVALALGLVWAVACRSSWQPLALAARGTLHAVRSTPLLIQLYIVFYIGPKIGLNLSPMVAGVTTLGIHFGSYAAEIYRAGMEGVERGQVEAAQALSMNSWQRFRLIVLPQALPPSIPALGNLFVAMFKDAPLLSAITVIEVLRVAKMIGSETFRYLEPMTMVGILFLIVSLIAAIPIRWLERRYRGAV